MAVEVKELDGRKWSDTSSGGSVKRRFRITGLATGFSPSWSYTGLPAVGSAHPDLTGYVCTGRDFEEGQGKEKQTVVVTVNYDLETSETSGSGSSAQTFAVDEWGWDDGTDEIELETAKDGTHVRNSAGDPFDSVPKVSVPSPVFTKVVKFKGRQGGWFDSNCKVNSGAVTIGNVSCPIGTLLCSVAEKRLIGNDDWKYQYTVRLRFKSNKVKIQGGSSMTEIGWDSAVSDVGMRALDDNGKKKIIRVIDEESGKSCQVTSPVLLDGQGKKLADNGSPYVFRFQAYERTSFPEWFYSEPS